MDRNSFLSSARKEDFLDGEKHNGEVHKPSGVLHIIQVILELFFAVVHAVSIGIIDLRPTGQTGADRVAEVVIRYRPFHLRHKDGALRAGPDHIHVSFEDVDELRYLIESELTD